MDQSDQVESCDSNSRKTVLTILMAGLGLASMFLCLFMLSRSLTCRVTTQVVVPSDRVKACIEFLESDHSRAGIAYEKTLLTPSVTVIRLSRDTLHPQFAQTSLDELAARITDHVTASITTQPVSDERILQLEARLRELDQKNPLLNSGGQGRDGTPVDIQSMLSEWRQQIAARQTLTIQLKELDTKLNTKSPDETRITISPDVITAAEARDQKLQADTQALHQRETRLTQLLKDLVAEGEPILERHSATIKTADQLVAEHVEEEQAPDLAASLAGIRSQLSKLLNAGSTLTEMWMKQHAALSVPEHDPLACQNLLEDAATIFRDDANRARQTLNTALETIGEGPDQPTKRLVLRNTLSQQLEESMDAQDAADAAARSVILLNNRELAALVETLAGLRVKVREQKERIVTALRREELTKMHSEYQAERTTAQAEQAKIADRAAELDAVIIETGNRLLEAVQQDQSRRDVLAQTRDLYQQRADVLSRLVQLMSEQHRKSTASVPGVTPFFVPGQTTPLLPGRPALIRAMLIGASPLGAGFLIWLVIGLACTLRRSRQARAEYAEIMQSASRRPRKKR